MTNDVTNIETVDIQCVAMILGRKDDLSHIDLSHCDTLVTCDKCSEGKRNVT